MKRGPIKFVAFPFKNIPQIRDSRFIKRKTLLVRWVPAFPNRSRQWLLEWRVVPHRRRRWSAKVVVSQTRKWQNARGWRDWHSPTAYSRRLQPRPTRRWALRRPWSNTTVRTLPRSRKERTGSSSHSRAFSLRLAAVRSASSRIWGPRTPFSTSISLRFHAFFTSSVCFPISFEGEENFWSFAFFFFASKDRIEKDVEILTKQTVFYVSIALEIGGAICNLINKINKILDLDFTFLSRL